jgi:tetratricopeptide (TPR) repeat protein
MTTAENLFGRAQWLLDMGRLMSGVEALEAGRRLAKSPDLLTWASYNLGVTYWARLGDGDAARREFNAVVAIFDEYGRDKISQRLSGMLPYALDNAMLLALSFDEFEHLASRVRTLTPSALTVIQLTPETLEARDAGQPWSDQLFKIAGNYYDRNDPSQDPGRYGEARSTYQLLLNHRRELRLARDRWQMATYELSALSLRMAADRARARENSSGTYPPDEFLPILAHAIPLIDDYLDTNPGDHRMEKVRHRAQEFVTSLQD